jgi:hypothetical protein
MKETKWNHSSKENSVYVMGQEIYWMQSDDLVLQAVGVSHFTVYSCNFRWFLSVDVSAVGVYGGGGDGVIVSAQGGMHKNIDSGNPGISVQMLEFFDVDALAKVRVRRVFRYMVSQSAGTRCHR